MLCCLTSVQTGTLKFSSSVYITCRPISPTSFCKHPSLAQHKISSRRYHISADHTDSIQSIIYLLRNNNFCCNFRNLIWGIPWTKKLEWKIGLLHFPFPCVLRHLNFIRLSENCRTTFACRKTFVHRCKIWD